jgi:hypothetical protein
MPDDAERCKKVQKSDLTQCTELVVDDPDYTDLPELSRDSPSQSSQREAQER